MITEVKHLLRFPHKQIRAQVIKEYMEAGGYERAVCFSCGHAAQELADAGVDVLHIGPHGVLIPGRWFTQAEIHRDFPGFFDATSGHLPNDAMVALAEAYKAYLGPKYGIYYVPTGSGETVVCLKMAYPEAEFVAVYNIDEATEYSAQCPLNPLVRLMCKSVIMDGKAWAERHAVRI